MNSPDEPRKASLGPIIGCVAVMAMAGGMLGMSLGSGHALWHFSLIDCYLSILMGLALGLPTAVGAAWVTYLSSQKLWLTILVASLMAFTVPFSMLSYGLFMAFAA